MWARAIRIWISIGLAWSATAAAQGAPPVVDYYAKAIHWTWMRGAPPENGVPAKFVVRCGPAIGQYTYPPSIRSVSVTPEQVKDPNLTLADSITIEALGIPQGLSYCVVVAENAAGPAKESVPLPFNAQSRPAAVSNVRLE